MKDYTSVWAEPIRDQGNCGSCWAFAATSVMSYYTYNKTMNNYMFSPQNLVDCSSIYGNYGCDGGLPNYAFEYIIKRKIALETKYKYMGIQVS